MIRGQICFERPTPSGSGPMRFFKATIAYDGSDYSGWQIQADRPSVQQTLEAAMQRITGEPTRVVASGRTDAGVHALGQVVSFATSSRLSADELCRALNAHTPRDISVRDLSEVPEGFHAIRDTKSKRYRYVIDDHRLPDVFQRRYAWQVPQRLDVEAMARAACAIRGTHDFSSFEASGSERASSVRTVTDVQVTRGSGPLQDNILIEIEADGFLYNMVRNIVGTLVEVGRGARAENWVAEVLAAKDRKAAGPTAPSQGLFLVSVRYE
jgi:tRNA pseudouridine38-40 synthase